MELAARVAEEGGWFLDSPVTGGSEGSRKATLSIMVGGDQDAFNRQKDVYEAMGSNIVYFGESGHGQISKMVNQMLMAAIYCSVAEAFAFASQAGVDIAKIYDAIEFGGAESKLFSGMKKTILSGEVVINNNLAIHAKDIDYAMEAANKLHAYLPITASTHEIFNIARIKGLSNIWSGSLFTIWEDLLQKKLNSTIRPEAESSTKAQ
jgi:2-hydroxy-3-oxopropionate reductase